MGGKGGFLYPKLVLVLFRRRFKVCSESLDDLELSPEVHLVDDPRVPPFLAPQDLTHLPSCAGQVEGVGFFSLGVHDYRFDIARNIFTVISHLFSPVPLFTTFVLIFKFKKSIFCTDVVFAAGVVVVVVVEAVLIWFVDDFVILDVELVVLEAACVDLVVSEATCVDVHLNLA